jgi:hypothetical protein
MNPARWVFAAALVTAAAAADSGTLRGPVSGYVLDARSRLLRPVNGIPGGATLGEPLRLGFRLNLAAVSAENDYAVVTAFRSAPAPVLLKGLSSGNPQVVRLDGAIGATALDLSDGGAAVLLTSAAEGKLQLIRGLPNQPEALPTADVSGWGGGMAAAAVDPTGTLVLAAAGDGSIFLYKVQGSSLGEPAWIGRVPGAAALSFAGADSAAVGSATTGDVVLFRGLDGALTVSRVAGAEDGVQSAIALRAIGGQELCVAEGSSGRAAMIDLATPAVHWLESPGQASRCGRLGRAVLVLNQAGREPLLLLDVSGPPKVFFVPVN